MKAHLLRLDNSVMVLRVLLAMGLGAALGLELAAMSYDER